MHGFNRDSRSRKLNKTNAQVLATAMNALQASMTLHNPEARAMFWGDMVSNVYSCLAEHHAALAARLPCY